MAIIPPQQPEQVPQAPIPGTTIEELPRHLKMLRLTEQELDALASPRAGLGLTFLGICVGAWIAFWTALQAPGLSTQATATLTALEFYSKIATAFFALVSLLEGAVALRTVRRIRRRPPLP